MPITYSEKLRDPRWQKKRLEAFKRDKFTCQLCGDKLTTLHVHHKVYKNIEIWEYEKADLITYYKHCHCVVEYCKKNNFILPFLIVKNPAMDGSDAPHLMVVHGGKVSDGSIDNFQIRMYIYSADTEELLEANCLFGYMAQKLIVQLKKK